MADKLGPAATALSPPTVCCCLLVCVAACSAVWVLHLGGGGGRAVGDEGRVVVVSVRTTRKGAAAVRGRLTGVLLAFDKHFNLGEFPGQRPRHGAA